MTLFGASNSLDLSEVLTVQSERYRAGQGRTLNLSDWTVRTSLRSKLLLAPSRVMAIVSASQA